METNDSPVVTSEYAQALTLFNEKKYHESMKMCRRLVKKTPKNINVINLLAINAHSLKKYKTAVKLYQIANKLSPNNHLMLNNQGSILRLQGDITGAIAAYQQAISVAPQQMEARFNLARLYEDTAQLTKAMECYDKILSLDAVNIQAFLRSGNLHLRLREEKLALQAFKKIITLEPNNINGLFAFAICLQSMEMHPEAIGYYQKILMLQPDNVRAYINLGVAYKKIEAYDRAIECYEKALTLAPNVDYIYTNLANALSGTNRNEEAIDNYNKALSLNPNSVEAYNGLGFVQMCLAHFDDAEMNFEKGLTVHFEHIDTHFNRSLNYLLQGKLQEGWQEYEWRMRKPEMVSLTSKVSCPLWDGSALDGRTLLIFAEQGFGDNIQFIRYLSLIEKQGGKIIFETRHELYRLFEQVLGIDILINRDELGSDADCYLPLLSLPRVFNTTLETIPAEIPYLYAYENDIATISELFNTKKGTIKVGICWAGNPAHKNTQNRSCQFTDFLPLLELSNIQFYSLQKNAAEISSFSGLPIIDSSTLMTDFAMSAAVIANLDLVIGVDTATVHLAGAMGKPVWNLLSFINDWRWMRDRFDTPWYPTMRLYRQPTIGDWGSIFTRVKHDLAHFKKKK